MKQRFFSSFKLLSLAVTLSLTACLDQPGTSGSSGGTSTTTIPYVSNINQPTNLVCDALSGATEVSADPTAGLIANLFYLEPSQPRFSDVHDYISKGVPVTGATLYFNEVNVPTRPFDRGFTTNEGLVILNSQGNTLYEYFALEYNSDIVLSKDDADGDYQFAILADDGAVLSMRGENGNPLDVLVDNNGTHPTKLGCATAAVNMNKNTRLPINYRYYQGPRYHIASMILYRPWPSDPQMVVDSECGKSGNSRFFDSTQNPPAPQAAYEGLLARGWKVLKPAHFKVPKGIENSCNVPAPTILDPQVVSVTSTTADLTWNTDIPATTQVEIENLDTGQKSVTSIDTLLVYAHAMTLNGLLPNTLYSATVISSSASGKSTRGWPPTTFRTRR